MSQGLCSFFSHIHTVCTLVEICTFQSATVQFPLNCSSRAGHALQCQRIAQVPIHLDNLDVHRVPCAPVPSEYCIGADVVEDWQFRLIVRKARGSCSLFQVPCSSSQGFPTTGWPRVDLPERKKSFFGSVAKRWRVVWASGPHLYFITG